MIVSKLMKFMVQKGFYYLDGSSNKHGYQRLTFSTLFNGRGDVVEVRVMPDGVVNLSYRKRNKDTGQIAASVFNRCQPVYVLKWLKEHIYET